MSMSEKPLIFRSKVDWWMLAIVACILLAGLAVAAWVCVNKGDFTALIFVLVCEVFTVGAILMITLPVQYELLQDKLVVRTGVLRSVVPLKSINHMAKCHSFMAGPTLSFDRLRIDYDNSGYAAYVLVSPEDQAEFIKQVELRRSSTA